MKIMLAVDGSSYTRFAARSLVDHLGWFAGQPEIHLVHVQPPLPYPAAQSVVGKQVVHDYQRGESLNALAVAEAELTPGGIPFRSEWRVGEVTSELALYAKENGIDLVVMGSHGHGALAGLALGSIATKLIATLTVPILVVRAPRLPGVQPRDHEAARQPANLPR